MCETKVSISLRMQEVAFSSYFIIAGVFASTELGVFSGYGFAKPEYGMLEQVGVQAPQHVARLHLRWRMTVIRQPGRSRVGAAERTEGGQHGPGKGAATLGSGIQSALSVL